MYSMRRLIRKAVAVLASRSLAFRYGMAPVAVCAALLTRLCLWPVIGAELPFLLLWPAVMLCAWYGGLGPGLLATLLSVLAAHLFLLDPGLSFTISDPKGAAGMALFVLLGLFLSVIGEMLRRAKLQVERHAKEILSQ